MMISLHRKRSLPNLEVVPLLLGGLSPRCQGLPLFSAGYLSPPHYLAAICLGTDTPL
jgi:hypothetical protein